jgi:type II secretory pathway component GspD/PulD (secretin)
MVVTLQYTPASDLANTLTNHFNVSDADVRIIAEPTSNSLLITAPAAELEEIRRIVAILDRRPKSVVVEATLLETVPSGEGDDAALKPLEERDFNGPANEVAAKVQELVKEGRVKSVRKLRLRAINNQLAQVNANEGHENVSGGAMPGGAKQRQIGQGRPGTVLSVTTRIADDDHIVMELSIIDSRPRTQRELEQLISVRAPEAAPGVPSVWDSALTTRALTTLTIKSGEAIVVHAGATNSTSQPSQVMVIVSAEVVK